MSVNQKGPVKRYLTELESYSLLERYGFPLPQFKFVTNEPEAAKGASAVGYPVAMKVVSENIIHKSNLGGVKLNVQNEEQLFKEFNHLISLAKTYSPRSLHCGVLISKMISGGIETIIGINTDPEFGRFIMFGLGGIYVELFKDVSFRLLPITQKDAQEVVSEVKSSILLEGFRGDRPKAIDKLVDVLLKCSDFAMENSDIVEMDLNPVKVREKDAVIVDAKIFKTL